MRKEVKLMKLVPVHGEVESKKVNGKQLIMVTQVFIVLEDDEEVEVAMVEQNQTNKNNKGN
jgi:hypothetical protein